MRSIDHVGYNRWLLNVGVGEHGHLINLPENSIQIPINLISNNNLVDTIYGQNLNQMSSQDLSNRIILAPTNKKTMEMNNLIISKLMGESKTYYSSDSIISEDPNDVINYPPEFLHELTPSGMPPHKLLLKKGVIIMLLRNLNSKKGLCNGSRLTILELGIHFLKAEIISECNRGDVVFLPRIDLAPSDTNLPFILKRRQFPIIPAYAITINKSQGQTFDHVGIYLEEPVFTHGQLYVALSRGKDPEKIKVYIDDNNTNITKNIVFKNIIDQ